MLKFLIAATIFLLLIAACAKNVTLTPEQEEFKQLCSGMHGGWMKMLPMQNGTLITEAEECWGCMLDANNHLCTKAEYSSWLQRQTGAESK